MNIQNLAIVSYRFWQILEVSMLYPDLSNYWNVSTFPREKKKKETTREKENKQQKQRTVLLPFEATANK